MREVNLKKLDLNLLVALHALLEEKHVSRAADRISLSQPAMSRALARLRDMFQDPLLVKGTRGMALTTRANDLQAPLQVLLSDISNLISPPSHDPASMQGEIVIATRDYELATLMPAIISKINSRAPHLCLRVVPITGDDLTPLEHHTVDFVLSGTGSKSATLHRYTLFEENYACLVAQTNPILSHGINLETYVKMNHCLVTITGVGLGAVDIELAKKNLSRKIVVRVPHFLAAAHIVADSDLVVTLPRRLGNLLSQEKKIALVELPLAMPNFSIHLYWHKRNQDNPAHKWLRNLIRSHFELS